MKLIQLAMGFLVAMACFTGCQSRAPRSGHIERADRNVYHPNQSAVPPGVCSVTDLDTSEMADIDPRWDSFRVSREALTTADNLVVMVTPRMTATENGMVDNLRGEWDGNTVCLSFDYIALESFEMDQTFMCKYVLGHLEPGQYRVVVTNGYFREGTRGKPEPVLSSEENPVPLRSNHVVEFTVHEATPEILLQRLNLCPLKDQIDVLVRPEAHPDRAVCHCNMKDGPCTKGCFVELDTQLWVGTHLSRIDEALKGRTNWDGWESTIWKTTGTIKGVRWNSEKKAYELDVGAEGQPSE
jgi:hypothetical protein